jgi:hypothetical protein
LAARHLNDRYDLLTRSDRRSTQCVATGQGHVGAGDPGGPASTTGAGRTVSIFQTLEDARDKLVVNERSLSHNGTQQVGGPPRSKCRTRRCVVSSRHPDGSCRCAQRCVRAMSKPAREGRPSTKHPTWRRMARPSSPCSLTPRRPPNSCGSPTRNSRSGQRHSLRSTTRLCGDGSRCRP